MSIKFAAVDSPKVKALRDKLAELRKQYDIVVDDMAEAEEIGESTVRYLARLDGLNADMADMFAQIRAAREAGE